MSGGPTDPSDGLVLRNALVDGAPVDVVIVGERIAEVRPAGAAVAPVTVAGTTIDLAGRLLLPAPAEPHAHLDKALTVDRVPNPAGDLHGAIEAWLAHRPTIAGDDYVRRATEAAELGLANGCTAIRTHVDLGPRPPADIGTTGLEALLEVKAALAPVLDLQLVGLIAGVTAPGPAGAEARAVLDDALDLGLDVVGGVPHIEGGFGGDPARAVDVLLEVAADRQRPVDLHADENLDPASLDLETLARRVLDTGFPNGATASHCVALAMKPEAEQRRIAELVAEAGVAVVALPQTNLYLQARGVATAPPRGLTALEPLVAAGATVAGGGDNLRDPFCPVGRADPLETAALLVLAGHRSPDEAYRAVSAGARAAMGLAPVEVAAGAPAELVALRAGSLTEAVAAAPADRLVIHRGRLVSGSP